MRIRLPGGLFSKVLPFFLQRGFCYIYGCKPLNQKIMIKKLLMAAVILATAVPAAAQGSRRSEVSVSYGVAPVTDWIDSYSNILTGVIAAPIPISRGGAPSPWVTASG